MRNAYVVEYGNLKIGPHEFDYELDDAFFEISENSILKSGNLKVLLHLERAATHLTLKFSITGTVDNICGVCLSNLKYPVESEEVLQVKITDSFGEEEPDLIYVSANEHRIDLYPHLYDYVHLALPIRIICEDSMNRSACERSVLDKLNVESNEGPEENPQWEKLKGLFKQ